MKSYFISFLAMMLFLGCSKDISESLSNPLVITSEREIISDLESLENHLFQSLNNSSVKNTSIEEIFKDSWLSSIKTDYSLDRPLSVEIKEHHPIANIGRDSYLTQRGKLINPKGQFKKLSVVSINGPDELGTEYIFSQKEFRVQLERLEDYISFELNSGKGNHIRYIDFRYNNAIAVYYS